MGRRERGRAGHSTDGREAKKRPRQNAGAIFEQAGNKGNGGRRPPRPALVRQALGADDNIKPGTEVRWSAPAKAGQA